MARPAGNMLAYNSQAIQKARAVDGRQTEYRIDGCRGLVLIVQPTGSASWWFVYHVRIGKVRKLRKRKLGGRDALSAHDARKLAVELLSQVTKGADPVAEKKAKWEALTFRGLVETRLEKDKALGVRTRRLWESAIARDALPVFGDVPAEDVTPEMVVEAINRAEARGALTGADNLRIGISSMFSWGRKRQLVKHNPTQGLGRRSTSLPRTRTLTDGEIRELWGAIDGGEEQISEPMGILLKLILLTGQRRTEVAGSLKSELDLTSGDAVWHMQGDTRENSQVAKGRTKSGRAQTVPLSRQAAKLFRRAVELSGDSEYVFPASYSRVKTGETPRVPHIHGDSVTLAMRRLRGQKTKGAPTVHDMRRTVATWLGEQNERSEVIAAVLNHAPNDVTRRHYNMAKLTPFVRKALQRWAVHVDRVVEGTATKDNVVEFPAA